MNEKIVLFGTGHDLPFYESFLDLLNIDFYCYADNDKNKWNTYLNNKKIISPSKLGDFNNKILISCSFVYEIKKQLEQIGLGSRIITIGDLVKYSRNNHLSYFEYLRKKKINLNSKKTIIIDLLSSSGWGGAEIWSYTVAKELKSRGHQVVILGGANLYKQQSEILEECITRYKIKLDLNKNYLNALKIVIDDLLKKMPFTFINNMTLNNMTDIGFIACYILKCYFSEYVKVISVLHGDGENYYSKCSLWQTEYSKILCVSSMIQERAYKEFGINKEKLIYKASPIDFDKKFIKNYSLKNDPLKIGYAARIEIAAKRADFIIPFIKGLIRQNVDFVLDIAGTGSFLPAIKNFVSDNNLEETVHVLGYIQHSNMPEFWKAHDVYVNFSETEGCPLTMTESMSYGVVPIVTDVGEARNFIVNGKNGFISDIGDLNDIVKNIKYLSENRNLLSKFGNICRNNIYTKCNKKDYIDTIENLCDI